jgi:chromatin remodeling complex protein RSC6
MNTNTESQASNTESQVSTGTVQAMLQTLVEAAANQAQQTRELHKNLKRLAVEIEKEQKKVQKSKPKRVVTQKPVQVQAAMSTFLQGQKVDSIEGRYTRQSMMKAVSTYIKNQKLQTEEDKKKWKPDAALAKLFNLDKKLLYSFMNINGLLSKVIVAAPKPASA